MRIPDLDDEDEAMQRFWRIVQFFDSDEVLAKVAKRLHRGAGPGGADANLMKDMLLRLFVPPSYFGPRWELG